MIKKQKSWFEIYHNWAHKFNEPEQRLSIDIAWYLNEKYPDLLWWHTPNEGKRGWFLQALNRLIGVRPGVPDIFIPLPAMKCPNLQSWYSGFLCELKIKPNKVKKGSEQEKVMEKLRENGYYVCVCYTLEEFVGEWEAYIMNLKDACDRSLDK